MSSAPYQPVVHRVAVATAWLALLPILVGAVVTSVDAGMSVQGWLTADGHPLLLYPWFRVAWDKFLEHGHRLAAVLIGVMSIVLVVTVLLREPRRWVQGLAVAVLLAVIGQGYLGGQRVLLDQRGLAFVHGFCASWVFALMSVVALVTSRAWHETSEPSGGGRWLPHWRWAMLVICLTVSCQYLLGGLLRHRGMALYEHMGFALVVAVAVGWSSWIARSSDAAWLEGPATLLMVLVGLQLGLGFGSYVVKFGFEDYVARFRSPEQVWVTTSHVLVGMLIWRTAVLFAVRVWRLDWLVRRTAHASVAWSAPLPLAVLPSAPQGGAAG